MAQAWDKELRARGYRVTPQRQLVLEAVTELEHGTPEEICATVQQTARGVNISTIYRALELLEQLGLVSHTHLGHGAPRYHLAAEAEHVHLVCSGCGRIIQIGPEEVSPLTGALVVADVVPGKAPENAGELEREILQLCREGLAPYKVPVAIRFVSSLQVAATGKLVRQPCVMSS